MIVSCEKCATRFRLDESKIDERGARVRCAKCQATFVVQRPNPIHQQKTSVYEIPLQLRRTAPPQQKAAPAASGQASEDPLDLPMEDADLIDEGAGLEVSESLQAEGSLAIDGTLLGFQPRPMSAGSGLPGSELAPADLGVQDTRVARPPALAAERHPDSESEPEANPQAGWAGGPSRPTVRAQDGRGPLRLVVSVIMGLAAVTIFGLGVLAYASGGRWDLKPVRAFLAARGSRLATEAGGYLGVFPVSVRSVVYPTARGSQVLVVFGEAQNRSRETRRHLRVVAELWNSADRPVAGESAPLGVVLGPGDLWQLTDRASLQQALLGKAASAGQPDAAPGALMPFSVIFLQPPVAVETLSHRVRLAQGEPLVGPQQPVVSAPTPAELAPGEAEDPKGKRKGQLKERPHPRGKRRAKPASDDPSGAP